MLMFLSLHLLLNQCKEIEGQCRLLDINTKSRMLISYCLGNLCHTSIEKKLVHVIFYVLIHSLYVCKITNCCNYLREYIEYTFYCVSRSVFIFHNIFVLFTFFLKISKNTAV